MELFYIAVFLLSAAAAAALEGTRKSATGSESGNRDFLKFRNNYVLVYSLMMAGDWLQGPFVYALYQFYDFDRAAIGQLFIAGFGSSMIIGTLVGSLADRNGRKKAALTYVATYAFGCFTKHWNNFHILLVGRVFCGVATSLLYSAFESWLVAEHFKRGYEGNWLGGTFSKAVFLGNGLIAIVAGLLGHALVEVFKLGPVSPFDAAALVLIAGGVYIALTWTENYGDSADKTPFHASLVNAGKTIWEDPRVGLLGTMQSLFEGSMYTFVFLWTPALSPDGEHLPHGMIFACFMVSSMAGSALAGRLLAHASGYKPERYMQTVFAVSAATLTVPVAFHLQRSSETSSLDPNAPGITFEGKIQLLAFCVFEACVGIFWPSMMKMRSQYVPEESRSTIINFFRIPLNLFVCIMLYNTSALPLAAMFGMCALFLLGCAICQRQLAKIVEVENREFELSDSNVNLLSATKKEVPFPEA
ncbi:hypothetical protein ABBQ38_013625 [Trebouxia sp. C0009 RCD-2024]